MIVAGETCPGDLVDRHFALRPASELYNEYGPTEATVWATVQRCEPGIDPVPIGVPIPGCDVRIVDLAGRVRPEGVVGELVIGGVGVVDGYLGGDDSEPRKFSRTPDGIRSFRTGDLAAVRNGGVRYLGRLDDQMNLGGVRVEPEEIERVLAGDPSVSAVIVVPHDPRTIETLMAALPSDVLGDAMSRAAGAADPAVAFRERTAPQIVRCDSTCGASRTCGWRCRRPGTRP